MKGCDTIHTAVEPSNLRVNKQILKCAHANVQIPNTTECVAVI